MTQDPLVIFTPSGKRGRFPVGTPVLTAARQLGVDLDSVCGGRGICSKCQITPSFGDFPKHGLTVSETALSDWNAVEERYDQKRGLTKGRRLGCQATVQSDIVIDVPPESQVHRQVVPQGRRHPGDGNGPRHPPGARVGRRTRHARTHRRFRTPRIRPEDPMDIDAAEADLRVMRSLQPRLRKGNWEVTVTLHHAHPQRPPPASSTSRRALTKRRSTASPSTWAPPPSRRI